MSKFCLVLVAIGGLAFFLGMRSESGNESRPGDIIRSAAELSQQQPEHSTSPTRRVGTQRTEAMPMLAPEVLDKVKFSNFIALDSGEKISPVAQAILQLSDDDCSQIEGLMRRRDKELLEHRYQQEQMAIQIEADLEDVRGIDMTWDVPVDMEATWRIESDLRDRVKDLVGVEVAGRLLGDAPPRESAAGQKLRHRVSAARDDPRYVVRHSFVEFGPEKRHYSAQMERFLIDEKAKISEHLLNEIESARRTPIPSEAR